MARAKAVEETLQSITDGRKSILVCSTVISNKQEKTRKIYVQGDGYRKVQG